MPTIIPSTAATASAYRSRSGYLRSANRIPPTLSIPMKELLIRKVPKDGLQGIVTWQNGWRMWTPIIPSQHGFTIRIEDGVHHDYRLDGTPIDTSMPLIAFEECSFAAATVIAERERWSEIKDSGWNRGVFL